MVELAAAASALHIPFSWDRLFHSADPEDPADRLLLAAVIARTTAIHREAQNG